MNKVFKVIWNHATQSWVAVSELTQAKGKTKSKSVAATAVAAVVLGAVSSAQAAQISPGASAPAGYDFFYVDRQGTPAVQSAPILGKTVVGNPNATYLNKPSDIDKNIWDQAFGNNATADGTVYGVPAGTTDIGRPTGGALAWGSNVLTKGAQSTTIGYNSTTLSPNSQNLGVRNTIGKDSHHVVAIGSENQVTHGHHNVLIGSHNIIEKGRGDKKLTEANAEAGSLNTLIGNRNILKSGKKDGYPDYRVETGL